MTRCFLSVGQGAFYCEQFTKDECGRKVNIVYDCGSLSGAQYVEDAINRTFHDDDQVDALFISHLDEDHINGVQNLLKKCSVSQIYFPLMTKGDKILLETEWHLRGGRMDYQMLELLYHPKESVTQMVENAVSPAITKARNRSGMLPKLIAVKPNDLGEYSNLEKRWDEGVYREYAQGGFYSTVNSGQNIWPILQSDYKECLGGSFGVKTFHWQYIPHNFRANRRIIRLKEALLKRGIGPRELEHSLDNAEVLAKVRAAYQEVPGSLNVNSMTVYSGPEHESPDGWNTNPGCLYMGDYDAWGEDRWNSLFKAYMQYWTEMGCVQLPHHGSRHNYNPKLAEAVKDPCAVFVASAGTRNQFRHPHKSVIMDLLSKGRNLRVVTEDPQSEVNLKIPKEYR